MSISKRAIDARAFTRPVRAFPNARQAFKAFLSAQDFQGDERVLLPSYVGWSPREGSGVFDPIRELDLPFAFYRLDRRLHLDLKSLEWQLQRQRVKVVVFIHYFGYVDPSYQAAVCLARHHGAQVLEDEAHAWLSDWVGGACGREGDACIASLHKLLPMPRGGLLVSSSTTRQLVEPLAGNSELMATVSSFDLWGIAERRRQNAAYLAERLDGFGDYLEPLWGPPQLGEVPQSFPVLVHHVSRDRLYSHLNDDGFGVVSLYHTLIREIDALDFPDSHRVARSILNLPVHQDISRADLDAFLERLAAVLLLLEEPAGHALGR